MENGGGTFSIFGPLAAHQFAEGKNHRISNFVANRGAVAFNWNFGDGATNTNPFPAHAYAAGGGDTPLISAPGGTAAASAHGSLTILAPANLSFASAAAGTGGQLAITVPSGPAYAILEQSSSFGAGALWTVVTNLPVVNGTGISIPVAPNSSKFYRLRQAW